jgi:hypothetical protein
MWSRGRTRPDSVDGDPELPGHEIRGVEGAVGHEHLEVELLADLPEVGEVGLRVAEEDLLEVERDALGALEALHLGEVLGEIAAVDLGRAAEREVRHAQRGQAPRVARARVEAGVVSAPREMVGEPCQRQEVPVERHRGEEDPHVSSLVLVTSDRL